MQGSFYIVYWFNAFNGFSVVHWWHLFYLHIEHWSLENVNVVKCWEKKETVTKICSTSSQTAVLNGNDAFLVANWINRKLYSNCTTVCHCCVSLLQFCSHNWLTNLDKLLANDLEKTTKTITTFFIQYWAKTVLLSDVFFQRLN